MLLTRDVLDESNRYVVVFLAQHSSGYMVLSFRVFQLKSKVRQDSMWVEID